MLKEAESRFSCSTKLLLHVIKFPFFFCCAVLEIFIIQDPCVPLLCMLNCVKVWACSTALFLFIISRLWVQHRKYAKDHTSDEYKDVSWQFMRKIWMNAREKERRKFLFELCIKAHEKLYNSRAHVLTLSKIKQRTKGKYCNNLWHSNFMIRIFSLVGSVRWFWVIYCSTFGEDECNNRRKMASEEKLPHAHDQYRLLTGVYKFSNRLSWIQQHSLMWPFRK